ncbi:hypothetical protein [Streptomyces sp. NPDC059802]
MRHLLPSHPVPEHRYIERVLRHSPDSLVRLIAATSPPDFPPSATSGSSS